MERRACPDRRAVDRGPERRRGRPPICEFGSERIDLRLPIPSYDELCLMALAEGLDVRAMAREILIAGISAVKNSQAAPTTRHSL